MNSMTLIELKRKLVAAHRAEDWELAKKLSQLKQKMKKRRYCVDCGVPIQKVKVFKNFGNSHVSPQERCQMHSIAHRFYNKALA